MRVVVVGRWGKVFDEVEVEIDLPDGYTYADLVAAMPAASAASDLAKPGGIFEGMHLAGEKMTWIVDGLGAGGRPWRQEVEAVSEVEAGFLAACAALEDAKAGRPSRIELFMEGLGRQRIVSAALEDVSSPRP